MEIDSDLTPYELRVKQNIEENQRVLRSLGLLNQVSGQKENVKKAVKKSNVTVKRRNSVDESPAVSPHHPVRRTRHSSSLLKSQGYDEFDDVTLPVDGENSPPQKRRKISSEPVFGSIEGVKVGDWWATRVECSAAGVHRPTVAGIHGKLGEGCYSIALSGGYEDDIDDGECFTYTGSGGRDLKGTKTNPKNLRTAPQTKDQVLEGPNASLALNIENHRPVRVIRGFKLASRYAPEEGYRYDGLYSVEKCWTATGLSGFKVFKYALKRLPGQDPPPWVNSGSDTSPQNGYGESGQNGLFGEDDTEESNTIQNAILVSAEQTLQCLESSENFQGLEENVTNGEAVVLAENKSQTAPKRKRTSSDLNLSSETTNLETTSPENLNSNEDIVEKSTKKDIQNQFKKIDKNSSIESEEISSLNIASNPLNSIENVSEGKKKVRFSPKVMFDDVPIELNESFGSIADCEYEDGVHKLNCTRETSDNQLGEDQNIPLSPQNNSNGDGKKQTSILKYFEPLKKADGRKVISRGISLRSNRRSLVPVNSTSVSESKSLMNDSVPLKSCKSFENKSEPIIKVPNKTPSTSLKSEKFLDIETNCYSIDKTENEVAFELGNTSNSEKKINSSCISTAQSPVKLCSVKLIRLDSPSSKFPTCRNLVNDSVPSERHLSPKDKNHSLKKFIVKKSPTEAKSNKRLFNQIYHSSSETEREVFDEPKNTRNSDDKENKSRDSIDKSLVKPCYLSIIKLTSKELFDSNTMPCQENSFLGWDGYDEQEEFLGFDLGPEHQILFYGFDLENLQSSEEYRLLIR